MNKIIEVLTHLISDNVIYSTIIILFVIGVVFCIVPVLRNIFQLRKATARVKKEGRAVLNDKLFPSGWLARCWESFRIENEKLEKTESHCEISNFFNDHNMITIPEHSQFSDILPGIFTSLGILGTFIGLTTGISGIDFASSEQMKGSIGILLSGMDVAFRTSIVGVIFAILYNLLRRHINSVAQSKVREFVQLCDSTLYDSFSPDNEMLAVMRSMLDHQTRLAEVIRNELVDALHSELQPQFKAIEGALSEYNLQNMKAQSEALKRLEENQQRLVDTITNGFNTTVKEQLLPGINQGIAEALNAHLVPAMSGMEKAFKSFASTSEQRQSESLDRMVKDFAEAANMLMTDQIKALNEAIMQTTAMQQKQNEVQQQQLELIGETLTALRASMDDVENIEHVYRTTIENFNNYASATQVTQSSMQALVNSLTDQFNQLLASLAERDAQLKVNLENFDSGMQSFEDYAAGLTQTMTALKADLQDAVTSLSASMNAVMDVNREQSKTTLEVVRNSSGEMRRIVNDGITDLSETVSQTLQAGRKQSETIEAEIQSRFNGIIERLDAVGKTLNENSNAAANRMLTATNQLKDSFSDFSENIANGLGQSFSGFDKAMSEAVSHLLQVLDGMQDAIDDIPKGIRSSTDTYMKEMEKMSQEVLTLIQEYESKQKNRIWGNR